MSSFRASTSNIVTVLTHQQRQAIATLQHRDIFAWLRLARTLGHQFQHCAEYRWLSSDEALAVTALEACEEHDIRTWLDVSSGMWKVCGGKI